MCFPSETLTPQSGEIRAHLLRTDTLHLFILIEFAPVWYDGEALESAITIDWIPFCGQSWRDIAHIDFASAEVQSQMQTAFTMEKSDVCRQTNVTLAYVGADQFKVNIDTLVNFTEFAGADASPSMPVSAELTIPFTGISLRRDQLFPKPNSAEEASDLIKPLIDTSTLAAPTFRDGVYRFRPM